MLIVRHFSVWIISAGQSLGKRSVQTTRNAGEALFAMQRLAPAKSGWKTERNALKGRTCATPQRPAWKSTEENPFALSTLL